MIGKCEIEFNMRFSVLGKIFASTLIGKSCLALEKNGLCVLGARGLNVKISLNGKTLLELHRRMWF